MNDGHPEHRSSSARSTIAALESEAMGHLHDGDFAAAKQCYERIVALDPQNAEAYSLLGVTNHRTGELEAARTSLIEAKNLDPNNAAYLANLGNVLGSLGDMTAAIGELESAIRIDPGNPQMHNDFGNILVAAGRHSDAVLSYRKALDLRPTYARAHFNLANALKSQGNLLAAIESYNHAISHDPRHVAAHGNLANALREAGRVDDAIARYRHAISIDADNATLHINLGGLLREEGRLDEAIVTLHRAVALDPGSAAAQCDLGVALWRSGDMKQAETLFRRAIDLDPNLVDAHVDMAVVHRFAGRWDDALLELQKAVEIDPGNREARFKRGMISLSLGRFRDGWRDYLCRESIAPEGHGLDRLVLEDDLTGQRVLVEGDQGLGDEIFFLRYLGFLRMRGAAVAYRPDPRLAAILKRAGVADEIVGAERESSAFDLVLSAGDLPHLIDPDADLAVPASITLSPPSERTAQIRNRLQSFGPPPYIAMTWRGGVRGNDRALFKEVPSADLGICLRGIDATMICVQRKPGRDEISEVADALRRPVHDLTALNDDLEDMLALVAEVDTYVTVSNTNVHLRHATGRPSHVLVANPPDFRWMADGDRSPWFPDSPVFRQRPDGDWSPALGQLRAELEKTLGS